METSDGTLMHSCKMWKMEIFNGTVLYYLILKSFNPKNPIQHINCSRSSHF